MTPPFATVSPIAHRWTTAVLIRERSGHFNVEKTPWVVLAPLQRRKAAPKDRPCASSIACERMAGVGGLGARPFFVTLPAARGGQLHREHVSPGHSIVGPARLETESHVSAHKDVVETYFEGFRRSDHEQILTCLTDDVVWDLPGYKRLTGKDAFDQEIENDDFVGSPMLTVDRLIEDADAVVAIGNGEATHKSGERHRFAFCTVFTFAGDGICRVESFLVPLKGVEQ
jgi:ketosteroid isomerase-like protein